MTFKKSIFFSLFAVTLLTAYIYPQYSNEQKEAVLMQTLVSGMERYHYSPQDMDDDFSEKVYDLYLERMDGGKRFLTAKEVSQLKKHRQAIDDQINASEFTFFNLSQELMEKSLVRAQEYYRDILAKPFDFTTGGDVELDGDKREFSANEKELRQYWEQYLKYETLNRYADSLEKQEKGDEELAGKSKTELEAEARADVLQMFDRWFDRLVKLDREDRLTQYFNAFTGVFDPHTNYYKPIDKENFDIRFSGKLEGIGARLITEGDYTKVTEVVVGGPAWKGKELEANDIITKVAQEGEDPVDIKGMVIDDVVSQIRGSKDTRVILTVKKVDGTEQDITITRDIVILDERFAKSLIIDGQAPGEKIGYLSLPSFYADFQDRNGRHCAEDVAKEIEKLKNVGVDGIVLDLRNNGGGSLRDVVKMSGFFIEKGPIVQVKSREYEPEVLLDVDPSVQYDGPLVVMVNNFSASASEILAAALQDYGRAVIVGSNSTFGKGTVQRFIDLDRTVRGFEDVKPLGQVKLTTQKFYRIDGGSTQLRGVTPDIILPDNYAYIETGEKEEQYPMPWTEIAAVDYDQKVLNMTQLDQVEARSKARIAKSDVFGKVQENAARMQKLRNLTTYPLDLEAYQGLQAARAKDAERFENLFDEVVNPSARNLEVDLPVFEADESKKARNEDFLKAVNKDVYIHEVLSIMHDIIELERIAIKD
jgi:carboxyl-terminal processing protease